MPAPDFMPDETVPQKRTPEADAEQRETLIASSGFDPGALPALLKRMSGAASGGMPDKFRRRELELTIPLEACRLDTFDQPFKLALRELNAAAELRAYRSMGMSAEEGGVGAVNSPDSSADSRGILMALAMGREALYSLNGHVMQDHEKDFFWECLNMAGRLGVGQAFLESGAGIDADTLGEISSSAVVS